MQQQECIILYEALLNTFPQKNDLKSKTLKNSYSNMTNVKQTP